MRKLICFQEKPTQELRYLAKENSLQAHTLSEKTGLEKKTGQENWGGPSKQSTKKVVKFEGLPTNQYAKPKVVFKITA